MELSERQQNEKDLKINTILNEMTKNASVQDVSTTSEVDSWEKIEAYIQTANAKILLNTLAPEVSANEQRKREHKDNLLKYVSLFLGVQFFIVFVLIMIVIIAIIVFHALEKDFSTGTIELLLAFFGSYITSVIVELICILKYIVVNVFDTSISALMEAFKFQNSTQFVRAEEETLKVRKC